MKTAQAGDRHWHYHIHTIEEARAPQHLGGMATHENGYRTATIVLHPVYQLCNIAMRMKFKQGIAPDHITTTENTPHHHIVGVVGEDSRHTFIKQATAANNGLAIVKTRVASHTATRKEEVRNQSRYLLQHSRRNRYIV